MTMTSTLYIYYDIPYIVPVGVHNATEQYELHLYTEPYPLSLPIIHETPHPYLVTSLLPVTGIK